MDSFDLSQQRIAQLGQIPEEIRRQIERGDSTAQYALDLSLNLLSAIEQIGIFQHVSQLDLSGNKLENVNGIQALRHLQSLDLSRNCIASVDLLALLPSLRVLKVAENNLVHIDALHLLSELQVFDASYNSVTKWPQLAGLTSLEMLDLSGNLLGAFPPSVAPALFPPRLRRLSIARNQIDEICGIACLGMQLSMLECFNFDGNAIVQQVRRYGAQLEFLLANLFQYVPLSDDGGLTLSCRRHDEYMVAPQTVDDLERAITQGQEAVVEEFLITGAVSNHGDRASIAFPPPAPPRELSPPLCCSQLNSDAEDGRIAADSAVILSKENKLAMWKRLQDSRKPQCTPSDAYVGTEHDEGRSKSAAWEQIEPVYNRSVAFALPQDRGRSPAYTTTGDFSVTPPFEPNTPAVVVPTLTPIQESVMATNDLIKVSPLLRDAGSDALQTQIKKLNEQVVTMRKYMKVWIKREKMVREAMARRLQRWYRRLCGARCLQQRILQTRARRRKKYALRHASSTLARGLSTTREIRIQTASAQRIQSRIRGFLTRQHIGRYKRYHAAASRVQLAWREARHIRRDILRCYSKFPLYRQARGSSGFMSSTDKKQQTLRWQALLYGLLHCARDVQELQRCCVVHEKVISSLWSNRHGQPQSAIGPNVEKAMILLQRLWRGHRVWKQSTTGKTIKLRAANSQSKGAASEMQQQLDRQSLEIDQLRQQLQSLQQLVEGLATASLA